MTKYQLINRLKSYPVTISFTRTTLTIKHSSDTFTLTKSDHITSSNKIYTRHTLIYQSYDSIINITTSTKQSKLIDQLIDLLDLF